MIGNVQVVYSSLSLAREQGGRCKRPAFGALAAGAIKIRMYDIDNDTA